MINNYNYFSITTVHWGTTITYKSLGILTVQVFGGNSLHLFGLGILPLWLNTCSIGTDVAGTPKHILCYCT